jgi:hypothetical protein
MHACSSHLLDSYSGEMFDVMEATCMHDPSLPLGGGLMLSPAGALCHTLLTKSSLPLSRGLASG